MANDESRVRSINPELPPAISQEISTRLEEISKLLAAVARETQGINRHRYSRNLSCVEELVEALAFAHYLKTQSLVSLEEVRYIMDELAMSGAAEQGAEETEKEAAPATKGEDTVYLTSEDYLYGIFDLSGEMMRFATTTTALTGKLATSGEQSQLPRTIVQDMQELGSFFAMLPQVGGRAWDTKMNTLRASVSKVEKLGYGITVRGNERGKGWVPDMAADDRGDELADD
jgi:predicted translin family RNA/ssDNA-binding protein